MLAAADSTSSPPSTTSQMPRFVPRQRKHRVLARTGSAANGTSNPVPTTSTPLSSNAEILIPQSKEEREARKAALRAELRAQQSKVSSKKQKRLDKYIETKLRKDETLDLLRKLEDEKVKYEATFAARGGLLGKRTFKEFVEDGRPRHQRPEARVEVTEDVDDSEDDWEAENRETFEDDRQLEPLVKKMIDAASIGSGLAQPLPVDEHGLPIIQSRKSKKRKKVPEAESTKDLPWEGFDTETSDIERGSTDNEDLSEFDDDESVETASTDGTRSSVDESDTSDGDDNTKGSTSETSDDDNDTDHQIKPRNSIFKLWATEQLNQSIGHTPSYTPGEGELLAAPTPVPKPSLQVPVPDEPPSSIPNRTSYAVHVFRPYGIQESRSQLPILQREQEIMEAIHNNSVVIVKGDTGSGKTTQIPQFLFESGYGSPEGPTPGMIGITQPRRVAAVSMAKRVATELGQHGSKVSYQIRFDSTVSSNTAVKFMTDGILLRELSQDLLLRKYSVIVIDEAHERSVNTDILIGMLSKIVPARMQKSKFNPDPKPLKLIIMSATLNIDDFLHERLFSAEMRPPIVEAEGRQHRVTTHFALRSRADYVEEVIEKVKRAHRKLPQGGILVFLTGQKEIREVANRLRAEIRGGAQHNASTPRVEIAAGEAPLEAEDMELQGPSKSEPDHDDFDDVEILTHSDEEAEEAEFDISDNEEEDDEPARPTTPSSSRDPYTSVHILPLYSQLPTSEQLKVFDPPPPNSRLIILATNVAETSLTIPHIRYVFDTGRSKERRYNLDTAVQSFEIDYISKASAAQRAGRAGRSGPGHCWRLYTSAVYEAFFPEHAVPEILRSPAESVVLTVKGFRYPRGVIEFPFPTRPSMQALGKAETLLKNLGALTGLGEITDLGRQLSIYPLSPRLGKILALAVDPANVHLIWHVVTMVAALSVPEIFVTEAQLNLTGPKEENYDEDELNNLRQSHGRARATLSSNDKTSDALKLLTAASLYLTTPSQQTCTTLYLRPKALSEISLLHTQLTHLLSLNNRGTITQETLQQARTKTKLSSSKTSTALNTLVASGYIDNIAIRADLAPNPPTMPQKPRRAIDVPYLPLQPLHTSAQASLTEKAIFIHPSSVLARLGVKDLPAYICYSHLQTAQAHTVNSGGAQKTRMFPLCPLTAAQISMLARGTALISCGKPLPKSKIEEVPGRPKRRECWVSCEVRVEGGAGAGVLGWPLPPLKVRQVMDLKTREGWRVEEVLS